MDNALVSQPRIRNSKLINEIIFCIYVTSINLPYLDEARMDYLIKADEEQELVKSNSLRID